MEGNWKYIGLTQDQLAMYMCTACDKVFVQQSPTREPPSNETCPSCGAKMYMTFGGPVMCHNCYTCGANEKCGEMAEKSERDRRADSECNCWTWPIDYTLRECPFCGNPAEIADIDPYEWCPNETIRAIRCSNQWGCPGHKAECTFMVSSKSSYLTARRQWNQRKKKNKLTWRGHENDARD